MKAALATHAPVKHETVPEPKKAHKPVVLAKVGDTVEYYTKNVNHQYHGDEGPYAAIVTQVNDGSVNLYVIPGKDGFTTPYDVFNVTDNTENPEWFQAR
jgi:hypothetical protein